MHFMKSIPAFVAWFSLAALTAAGCAGGKASEKPDKLGVQAPPPEPTAEEYYATGVKAAQQGDLDAARRAFQRSADKDPKNASALFNLGVIAEKKGDFKTAETEYLAVLEVNPDHFDAALNLGHIYRLQDKPEKSIP